MQNMNRAEPPPSYTEALGHRVVPTAPPFKRNHPSCSQITKTHANHDLRGMASDVFGEPDDSLPEYQPRTNMPNASLRPSQHDTPFATDSLLYTKRQRAPRRRASEPTHMCPRHMMSRRRCFSEGSPDDTDADLVTFNVRKRSTKRKVVERLVLGSWLVFWPIYLPITLMRESPTDEDDFYDDVLLSEAYRIGQKISPDKSHRHCSECQRMR